ncbi:ATP-binding protein [Verrucomicrobium sp. GAS474]|uniref:ATP-binding protein n=1 Tax=Verrucomicrobium sp. GAS474 TaxID=1882831 RepID=UPI001390224F|nr:ATP-binding protein [Verrucomicrobium sp. GAS474]
MTLGGGPVDERAVEAVFGSFMDRVQERTNRFFAFLLLGQWVAAIAIALIISPLAWEGRGYQVHPHVWAAVFIGGLITLYPAWLGLRSATKGEGTAIDRRLVPHIMAVAQMLTSSLFIHLTGGRIETHFHIFGSLALLAFYRKTPVLLTATAVTCLDHLLRGLFWPESVYGVFTASPWRTLEHGFWVLFEVAFLAISIRGGRQDLWDGARRRVVLENVNGEMERIITERTTDLQKSEERFRTLFKDAPIGLYHADPQGTLLLANRLMVQILGYASREELKAHAVNFRKTGESDDRQAFFDEVVARGEIRSRDTAWRRADGSLVHVRESVRAYRNEEGKLLHFEGSVEDITERRHLEERYFQSQKVQAIGQLAGGVAHDFNNILTAILGYTEMIVDEPGSHETPSHAAEIRKAAERAADLTRQLLAFSRKQTLQPRVFALNEVVSDLDKMLRRLVGENIEIRTKLDPRLGLTKADPGQIQQVIMNLTVNARDAMPSGGRLTIETSNVQLDKAYLGPQSELVPGEYVMISISDSGIGMTPEVKARIFEPFFTTKGEGQGTGLGLATCHGIVRQSGGQISVYSEVGIGTTFRVYLPRTRELLSPVEAPVKTVSQGGGEVLLFVEDEPMVRQLGSRALTSLGYRVIEAENGVEALQIIEKTQERPALLVTDVVMPKMGGGVLSEMMRERIPGLPVLFTSGYTQEALDDLDLAKPGISFLPKPYSMSDLGETVGKLLGR